MLRPLDDRVLVKLFEAKDRSEGGILLPDQAKPKPQRGKVLAIGPGKRLNSGERAAMEVRVGDIVIFPKYGGTPVPGDETLSLLFEHEILAKVEE